MLLLLLMVLCSPECVLFVVVVSLIFVFSSDLLFLSQYINNDTIIHSLIQNALWIAC
jgi:hypothetical protein